MILFRPVGLKELERIAESGFRAFPPRLPFQPIFYPVLNFTYAEQIAERWNTNDAASGYAGFVTRFEVEETYVQRFPVQVVGAEAIHQELWVPSEQLDEFNGHILGTIMVETAYYGPAFVGERDPATNLPAAIARIMP